MKGIVKGKVFYLKSYSAGVSDSELLPPKPRNKSKTEKV